MPLKKTEPVRLVFRGAEIATVEEFYDAVVRQLGLGAGFGRNLDALWDLLSTDVPGPLTIIWENADLSRKKLGEKMTAIESLLADLASERDDVEICLK